MRIPRTIWAGAAVLLASCGDPITGTESPNRVPDTQVTATPPALEATDALVEFYWKGSDPDGPIAGFEWRISNNGPDGVIDEADTLESNLPWQFTTARDSIFIVTADLPDHPELENFYWHTHTFFIRAVDENGARDPSPAHVSFTAVTLAPTVRIVRPIGPQPDGCSPIPSIVKFIWEGDDPEGALRQPTAFRYLLKKAGNPGDPCLTRARFMAGEFPISGDDPEWSEWLPRSAAPDTATAAAFNPLPHGEIGTTYILAVQARDLASAVTPTFEWGVNVRHFRLSDDTLPTLAVSDPFLGMGRFEGSGNVVRSVIPGEQTVAFRWNGDASDYGSEIAGFRYGFDILDEEDSLDPGWAVDWGLGLAHTRFTPTTLGSGARNVVIQARDAAGQTTSVRFQFEVNPLVRRSEQRRLLLVDDFPKSTDVPSSESIDLDWDRRWIGLMQDIGVREFTSYDIIDATDEPVRLTATTVNDYRGIIWFVGPGESYLRRRFTPRDPERLPYNWLEAYQAFLGNVMIAGPGAMNSFIEDTNTEFPVVLDASGMLSLGVVKDIDGETINAGTLRYPYTGWCLEAIDMIRPLRISGERPGTQDRATNCSAITYAGPANEFFVDYWATPVDVPALLPNDLREFGSYKYYHPAPGLDPTELSTAQLGKEEFYNANVTLRVVSIELRDCQVPMYRAIARRDVDEPSVYADQRAQGWDQLGLHVREGIVDSILLPYSSPEEWVDDCPSTREYEKFPTSPISLQVIGIASNVYSGRAGNPPTKQGGTLVSSDILWGFNPLLFQSGGIRSAIRWIVIDHWGVNAE